MTALDTILDARDLTDEVIAGALESRVKIRELLERVAKVTRPKTGAPRVLSVFVAMASPDCDWLEGGLKVDLIEKDGAVVVDVFTDIGGGLKERVLPSIALGCPLQEFVAAIAADPGSIAPLRATRPAPDRVLLSAEEAERAEDEEEPEPPQYDSRHLPVGVVHLPTVEAAPADLEFVPPEAPESDALGPDAFGDDLPPVSVLQPGQVPAPIEFDDWEIDEPPPSSIPASAPSSQSDPQGKKPLARVALKKQNTRPNLPRSSFVVAEEVVPRKPDDRSE